MNSIVCVGIDVTIREVTFMFYYYMEKDEYKPIVPQVYNLILKYMKMV